MPTDWKTETQPILEEIRSMIRRSELSQRQVERLAGFSKGYLSQLLAQNLDLKVWHLLAILDVFEVSPVDFFEHVCPTGNFPPSLETFDRNRGPIDDEQGRALDELYGLDVDGLARLRRRLERRSDPPASSADPGWTDASDGAEPPR